MSAQRPLYLELQVRRIDLLYRQNLTAPLINACMTAFFLYFTWDAIAHGLLIAWAVAMNASPLVRLFGTFRWLRAKENITQQSQLDSWHSFLVIALAITGICFGIMGAVSAQVLSGFPEFIIGMIIIGCVSASVAVYAPSLICTLSFLIPSISIWAISFFMLGSLEGWLMGGVTLFFLLIQVRLALNWNRYTHRSIDMNLALHEKEERLRHNRDASGAVDWEWNLATNEFSCEGNLEYLFGSQRSFFRGELRDYLDRVHPLDRESFEKAIRSAAQSGTLDVEHRVLWPDGKIQFVAVRGRVQSDEAERPVRMTGIAWNITAKKIEEQLRHERDVYEAADRAKLMFLANASHEIRTPLAAINGFTELALENPELPPGLRENLQTILRNGHYLTSLVNDLLDLSKTEADHLYIQKAKMWPLREIRDSLMVVQESARAKGIRLNTIFETEVPETIHADATRFRQILINLLTNAVKYTNEGSVTVHISYLPPERETPSLFRVVVADTGVGIDEETRKTLFQPFTRGRDFEVQKVQGSGLGLALSRNLARKMGGDLRLLNLKSESFGSSFFELTIETGSLDGVRFVRGEEKAPEAPKKAPGARGTEKISGQKILLVEDQPDLRELMQRYLERHGAEVQTAAHGAEGVELALKGDFDVVLMDIQMPIMNGYQATQILREKGYRKPIIALTAHASTMDRQKCLDAGCDFYFSKPVNTSELLEVLSQQIKPDAPSLDKNNPS